MVAPQPIIYTAMFSEVLGKERQHPGKVPISAPTLASTKGIYRRVGRATYDQAPIAF
jgi:hypothetical protein